MLLRRLARPLLASWFVAEGLDSVRRPGGHVAQLRDALDGVALRAPEAFTAPVAPQLARARGLDNGRLSTVVRLHGAAMVAAATTLALGRAPRTSAWVLAGHTAPLVVATLPERPHRGADAEEKARRRARRDRFIQVLALTGGVLLAGADTAGRPSLVWRARQARERARKASADTA